MAKSYTEPRGDPIFLNHRPASGIPIELLHPVFATFLDDCQNIQPEPVDMKFVMDFSTAVANNFDKEKQQQRMLQEMFRNYAGIDLIPCKIGGCETDGTWWTDGQYMAVN